MVEFDNLGKVLSIEEKALKLKSHYAAPGIYFYENKVVEIASRIKPSLRRDMGITDVNKEYL